MLDAGIGLGETSGRLPEQPTQQVRFQIRGRQVGDQADRSRRHPLLVQARQFHLLGAAAELTDPLAPLVQGLGLQRVQFQVEHQIGLEAADEQALEIGLQRDIALGGAEQGQRPVGPQHLAGVR